MTATNNGYADYLGPDGKWTAASAYKAIDNRGHVCDIGQIGPASRKVLDGLVKDGTLVKYRGHFNTLLTFAGMGPLKTIWATPEIAEAAGATVRA